MRFLVTGGAGFIGSAVARRLAGELGHEVLVVDKLTYAGSLESLKPLAERRNFEFLRADVCDRATIVEAFRRFQPDVVMHLAAESHVDRSIDGPGDFIQTNLVGAYVMLEAARLYWRSLAAPRARRFRYLHISTDEVFGSLGSEGRFREDTAYAPNSPYAATKAGADHLVRAWCETYGLPAIVTNCSNNYGPFHFPEKLIPLSIINAVEGRPIGVYGKGVNVRDWLYVDDHAEALIRVACDGAVGDAYLVGGRSERRNIDVVEAICGLLDEMRPKASGSYRDQIAFIDDRPGHDHRYAIECGKIERELGWRPRETFESGLRKTVRWYLDNANWWRAVRGAYRGERLGRIA